MANTKKDWEAEINRLHVINKTRALLPLEVNALDRAVRRAAESVRAAKWRAANLDKVKARQKRYLTTPAGKAMRARADKKAYDKNPNLRKERAEAWRIANPDKMAAHNEERKEAGKAARLLDRDAPTMAEKVVVWEGIKATRELNKYERYRYLYCLDAADPNGKAKARAKIASKKWHDNNLDKIHAQGARWRAANPDKVKASNDRKTAIRSAIRKAKREATDAPDCCS